MATDPDVIRLVELYLRSRFYRKMRFITNDESYSHGLLHPPPYEMLCGPPDLDGLTEWRPVDSPVDEKIVAGFERFLGVGLPPAFKSLLTYKCLLETDLHFAILPELDPRHPLGWLEWSVKESRDSAVLARPWYVPFTSARAEMGVLCFDTQRPSPDGDYPVMLAFDRSIVSPGLPPEYAELHASFKSYLGFICDVLEYTIGFHDNPQPLADWLTERGRPVPPEVRYYQP